VLKALSNPNTNPNLRLPYACRCTAARLRRSTRSGWRGARATWSSTPCSRPRRRAWATRWPPRPPRCPSCGSSWACPGSRSEGGPGLARCRCARGPRLRGVGAAMRPCRPAARGRPAALLGDAGAALADAARAAAASWACHSGTLRACPGSVSVSHARMSCAGTAVAIPVRPACRCCLV